MATISRRRGSGPFRAVLLLQAIAAGSAFAAADGPRLPDQPDGIARELRVGADVFRAALTDAMPEERRVLDVEAGFLAHQGVLVTAEVADPWFHGRAIDIGRDITSLEQIPEMVQEILSDMNLGLTTHQAEELKELREIRDAQRRVRAQQRELRAERREKRRALLRRENESASDTLRRQIDELDQQLAALQGEERALEADVRAARSEIGEGSTPPGDATAQARLDQAVAEAACNYGATFRSLPADQYLNLVVRQPGSSRYYVFRMGEVRRCQVGELTAEQLLAESFAYPP